MHHGIPAVLHLDEPWLHRHSENGALRFIGDSRVNGSPNRSTIRVRRACRISTKAGRGEAYFAS